MDLSGHEGEIPIPMTNSYVVHGHFNSRPPPTALSASNINTEHQQEQQQQQQQAAAALSNSNRKIAVAAAAKAVRYRECLKNHAASMGGNATDGCGEFMPSGEEGSLESFRCSACSCHRNFHRKEVEGEPPAASCLDAYYHLKGRGAGGAYGGYMPRPAAPPALIMPLGAAMHASESDEAEEGGYGGGVGMMVGGSAPVARKRFRTKFTQEQKEKMLAFAERVGWRLQRQEEGLVQHFCQEVGVKRRVLKVWMHNNKHNFAKKTSTDTTTPPLQQQQQQHTAVLP
ncbi:putative zinc-finger homeodomain protein 3 [Iris pallida]|uniref:Zinc-finger homeodomain protein 3 n=1 Tax=Iris pallida TaxID=29817 RepID=A0AAX6ENK7_IRIPA|nr:putative zinc-finger homeodomain protein 3 [Iris pallida]